MWSDGWFVDDFLIKHVKDVVILTTRSGSFLLIFLPFIFCVLCMLWPFFFYFFIRCFVSFLPFFKFIFSLCSTLDRLASVKIHLLLCDPESAEVVLSSVDKVIHVFCLLQMDSCKYKCHVSILKNYKEVAYDTCVSNSGQLRCSSEI